ncbi:MULTISPECIES: hypothetical protein [unclassified Chryseobacterium]|uniref:hypothetical protein n=1 Tax=Chryseobacterium TaxID=59732 RepID=UPI000E70FF65|nr:MULTISPECIES: hypothetical protein [unclassified Chryseobacterium]QWT88289.1 hypothetical protein KBP46_10970 [Chryseobacterium sp. PCH239]RKE75535.1 hypothetical protein DEU39_4493 [Chryseobacterium sp. AG363]WNI36077.1 hypothetical protein RHP76_19175 [Chryseobacterium sp. SG20098]
MNPFEPYIALLSETWKSQYKAILAQEHLKYLEKNIQKFKDNTLELHLPYFNEEIIIDRKESFEKLMKILDNNDSDDVKAQLLEEIPFEHWLNVLGQRLTSASIRDENAIPPLKGTLINACKEPFNNEITIAQRAWEKHIGRMDDDFWGEIKGNNQQKQEKVMAKINDILDHKTWWNVFFHYKHELVFEVREKEGHGIRWSHGGTKLIGFLEKFINE